MKYFRKKKLKLTATCDCNVAFKNANYIIICTPTNYNNISGIFYTSCYSSDRKDEIKVESIFFITILLK